jgi:hypothetical protein
MRFDVACKDCKFFTNNVPEGTDYANRPDLPNLFKTPSNPFLS